MFPQITKARLVVAMWIALFLLSSMQTPVIEKRMWFVASAEACSALQDIEPQTEATQSAPWCGELRVDDNDRVVGLPLRVQVVASGNGGRLRMSILRTVGDAKDELLATGETEVRLNKKPSRHVLTLEPTRAIVLSPGSRLRFTVEVVGTGGAQLRLGKESFVELSGVGNEVGD